MTDRKDRDYKTDLADILAYRSDGTPVLAGTDIPLEAVLSRLDCGDTYTIIRRVMPDVPEPALRKIIVWYIYDRFIARRTSSSSDTPTSRSTP